MPTAKRDRSIEFYLVPMRFRMPNVRALRVFLAVGVGQPSRTLQRQSWRRAAQRGPELASACAAAAS